MNAVQKALRSGATGIMIDASKLSLDQNIMTTKAVVDLCSAVDVPVEGELGHIGTTSDKEQSEYTKVDEAGRYVAETGVQALAVMIGTAHGHYRQAPVLAINRLKAIAQEVKIPIVLHGGSGIPDEQIRSAIRAGVRKINFGTDICMSFLDAVRSVSSEIVAVDLFMQSPIESVKAFAKEKIALLREDL
jgi:fructose-bisphosphate aldolase class II